MKKTIVMISMFIACAALIFSGCVKAQNEPPNDILYGDIDDCFTDNGWFSEDETWSISLTAKADASIEGVSTFFGEEESEWNMVMIVSGSVRTSDKEREAGDIFFTHSNFSMDVSKGAEILVMGEKPDADLNAEKLCIYLTTGEVLTKEIDDTQTET